MYIYLYIYIVAVVAPRTGKIVKNGLCEELICYKMVYYALCLDSVNRQKSCYNLSRRKTHFSERGLALKGLTKEFYFSFYSVVLPLTIYTSRFKEIILTTLWGPSPPYYNK